MHPAVAAVRADLGVERHLRAPGSSAPTRPRRCPGPPRPRADAVSRGCCAARSTRLPMPQRQLRDALDPARDAAARRSARGAAPTGAPGGVRPTGHRVRVEQHGREVDAGDAVDERVVRLADQREAVALEALHEPHLPERLRAVEPLGEDAPGQQRELVVVARRGQRGVADVVLEVEARVVDPDRLARPEAAGRRASAGSAAPGAAAPRRARGTRRSSAAGPRRRRPRRCACARTRSPGSGSWRPSR